MTDTQKTILMEQIVNPALFAWSQALRVVPVGNDDNDDDNEFGVDGAGAGAGAGGKNDGGNNTTGGKNNDSLVVDKTQLYDGESCGPGLVSLC